MHGWVDASYIGAHAPGEQGDAGRINGRLEAQGYHYVIAKSSDTIWTIASANCIRFEEIVALNTHIIDPDRIYVGDRVYLPGTTLTPYFATDRMGRWAMSEQNLLERLAAAS